MFVVVVGEERLAEVGYVFLTRPGGMGGYCGWLTSA